MRSKSAPGTTFFFAAPDDFDGAVVSLRDDEAHHASRVLRLRTGDEIQIVDGMGGWYRVTLDKLDGGVVRGSIIERRLGVGESSTYVHLAVAGLKSRSRFDMILEKATELGVSRVTVLDTQRAERARVDVDRSTRLMRAAMKQCKRSRIPLLEGPVSLSEFLSAAEASRKLVCHNGDGDVSIPNALDASDRDVTIAVGPEGGFADDEIDQAIAQGFQSVHLGPRRLRTETACLVACSAILMTGIA